LAKASIIEELRDVTLHVIQEVVSAHQDLRRIEEEQSMDVDSVRNQGVEALENKIVELQSNAQFSQ
jgi:hypothetical protein